MKKIVLTFGLISGGILAAIMAITIPFCLNGTMNEAFGYTTMLLALLAVFFGIRSYRENVAGGTITFGKAFTVGIFITLIACAFYVISWEIIYYGFIPDFTQKYAAHMIEKARASGASAAVIEKTRMEMARFQELYKNPLFNVGMTFMEIFPVGLVVTLVSAAILRRKPVMAT